MNHPWEAEIFVDVEKASHLIKSQFPEISIETITLMGQGWDNAAFLVNESIVFRFPKRGIAAPQIATEAKVLPQIASTLPFTIPVPEWIGNPSDEYPWQFAGYEAIRGTTACSQNLNNDQRISIGMQLAVFLKSLHSISVDQGLRLGAPRDEIGRLDVSRRVQQIENDLDRAARAKLIDDDLRWTHVMDAARDVKPRVTCLCHGDLYARHVLVDDSQRLCGVIDWGDVHVGDPAVDLAIVFQFLPAISAATFFEVYGSIGRNTFLLARLRALSYGLTLIIFAAETGDVDLAREGEFVLNQLRAQ